MSGSYMVGLDLGQVNDYSALAVVERVKFLPPGMTLQHWERHADQHDLIAITEEVHVRHLQRWELGTPYHAIVAEVAALMATPQLADAWLSFDATGVGVGVKDMLNEAFMAGRMNRHWPLPVTITGADHATAHSIPKRDLMTTLQLLLQQGRLKIAAGLPLGESLERELTSYRMKVSAAGRDSYDIARREGEGHGDLTIAVALAARRENWSARPELIEAG